MAVGGIFWLFVFGLLYRLLNYFRGIPEIGALLAAKLLGLMFVSLFGILILSNVVTALSSFFLAKDLDLLVAGPVDWLRLYGAKLLETTGHSSWMVVLVATPVLTAYGISYEGGFLYPLIAIAAVLPFLFIPAAIGSAVTLILVNIFPAKRTRDILSVIAVLAAAGVVLIFRLVRPERLARPEGFRSLVEFISLLRTPTSAWMPSEWVAQGIMTWLRNGPEILPFYLLWSTAAVTIVFGALLHRWLYARGFSKSQESGERWVRQGTLGRLVARALTPWGVMRRELVLKEMRLFFRDTTQWSQLILLTVLVVVYVFNIKFLPLRGEGITFFLQNVIPFVNLILAGFVLASIAARFIFPGISLEGRTLWLLRSSPLRDGAAALVQVLGRNDSAPRARARPDLRHGRPAAGEWIHDGRVHLHHHPAHVRDRRARARLRRAVPEVQHRERGPDTDVVWRTRADDGIGRADRSRARPRGAAGLSIRWSRACWEPIRVRLGC